ncbi:hypothetical protein P9869_26145 [Streptomyces ossamyceticus]|nr:hypothetical protein [Streptomyces ossamyceticus]
MLTTTSASTLRSVSTPQSASASASGARTISLGRKRYAVLLAGSAVVAFALRAVRDALALRALRRRTDRCTNRRSSVMPVTPTMPVVPTGPPTTVPPLSLTSSLTDVAARRPRPALVSR